MFNSTPSMQSSFNKSILGIIGQGRKSCYGSFCLYRSSRVNSVLLQTTKSLPIPPPNLKCAIGHLLTDEQIEKYKLEEGDSVLSFPDRLIYELIPDAWLTRSKLLLAYDFLRALQYLHDHLPDDHNFVSNFVEAAQRMSVNWGLKMPI